MDHGHRELPTAESIGYGAVSILERPRDLRTVPVLGVSDIAETKVVLFGPKKWDVVEGFTLAEDIMRRCLALALGDDPVFDSSDAAPERKPFDRLGRSHGVDSSALSIVMRPE